MDHSAQFPLRGPLHTAVEAAGPSFSPFPAPSLFSPPMQLATLFDLLQQPASVAVRERAPLAPVAVMRAVPDYLDRPMGTWAEQCVAADLSFIDPIRPHQSPIIAVHAVKQMWWIRGSSDSGGSSSSSMTTAEHHNRSRV